MFAPSLPLPHCQPFTFYSSLHLSFYSPLPLLPYCPSTLLIPAILSYIAHLFYPLSLVLNVILWWCLPPFPFSPPPSLCPPFTSPHWLQSRFMSSSPIRCSSFRPDHRPSGPAYPFRPTQSPVSTVHSAGGQAAGPAGLTAPPADGQPEIQVWVIFQSIHWAPLQGFTSKWETLENETQSVLLPNDCTLSPKRPNCSLYGMTYIQKLLYVWVAT